MKTTSESNLQEAAARRRRWRRVLPFALGLLTLSGLVVTVLHFGEIERFAALARSARTEWLLLAVLVQIVTYACPAGVWYLTLHNAGKHLAYNSLIPLSVAKLFTDQAVPTGGVSGAMLVVGGLLRRNVQPLDAMATMLVSLVSYYGAYLFAVATSVALLWWHHYRFPIFLMAAAALAAVSVGIPVLVLITRHWRPRLLKSAVERAPALAQLLQLAEDAPTGLLRDPKLLLQASALQLAVFVLDGATLWIVFLALGQTVPFWSAFVALMAASVAATLGPVPLGLGTFEAGAVGMLTVVGTAPEAALAATMLLRGMTFWLPMLPGLWLARREIANPPHHFCST